MNPTDLALEEWRLPPLSEEALLLEPDTVQPRCRFYAHTAIVLEGWEDHAAVATMLALGIGETRLRNVGTRSGPSAIGDNAANGSDPTKPAWTSFATSFLQFDHLYQIPVAGYDPLWLRADPRHPMRWGFTAGYFHRHTNGTILIHDEWWAGFPAGQARWYPAARAAVDLIVSEL